MNEKMKLRQFVHGSVIPAPLENIVAFHESEDAFQRLIPPPMSVTVHRDNRQSLKDGEIEFSLKLGPLAIPWLARHKPGHTAHSFIDEMVSGPMATWEHEHIFERHEGGTKLTDRITYAYPEGIEGLRSRLLFNPLGLKVLFLYRHWATRKAAAGAAKRRNDGA